MTLRLDRTYTFCGRGEKHTANSPILAEITPSSLPRREGERELGTGASFRCVRYPHLFIRHRLDCQQHDRDVSTHQPHRSHDIELSSERGKPGKASCQDRPPYVSVFVRFDRWNSDDSEARRGSLTEVHEIFRTAGETPSTGPLLNYCKTPTRQQNVILNSNF